jgi:glyoxylase-like metal-dependent hydrolase (beta-lactamase superfamily II)
MRVHHLNCGTMRPCGAQEGLVCHVLLIEAETSLALVDSGLGLQDIAHPGARIGPVRFFLRPVLQESETAIRQVEKLGFDAEDVRDIVLTHFDLDHVGGLTDFPWARVHVTAAEATGALNATTLIEKVRYKPAQRAHNPALVQYAFGAGDDWRGFAAAKELNDIAPGIVLIDLPGHTRGHAAVAVEVGDRWLLHVGDSFYHHRQIDRTGKAPASLRLLERLLAFNWTKVQSNHARLASLWYAGEPSLALMNSHDPNLLRQAQARATT